MTSNWFPIFKWVLFKTVYVWLQDSNSNLKTSSLRPSMNTKNDAKVMSKLRVSRSKNNQSTKDSKTKDLLKYNLSICLKISSHFNNKMLIKRKLLKIFNFSMISSENSMINALSIMISWSISSNKFSSPFSRRGKRYKQAKLWSEPREICVKKQNKLKTEWKKCSKAVKPVLFNSWKSILLLLKVRNENLRNYLRKLQKELAKD